MKNIELPYMRITKVNELLKKVSLSQTSKEITAVELSRIIGVGKSSISNLLTTLKAIKLIEGRGKLTFTEAGKKYVAYLLRNDEKNAKEIIKNEVETLDFIQEVKQKLSQKGKLSISEIGNHLAAFYDQKWENPLTVKAYGASVASILDFTNMGYYRGGILHLKQVKEITESIPAPSLSVKKIFTILKGLLPSGKTLQELSAKIKTKEGRLSYELSACIELNLVERPYKGFYKLTKKGEEFVSPYIDKEKQKIEFRNQLLLSRYSGVINNLDLPDLDAKKIGEVLKFEFGRAGAEWSSEKTVQGYTKKFINWLLFSGFIEKVEKNQYRFNKEAIKSIPQRVISEKIEVTPVSPTDLTKHYLLGKAVGQITQKNTDSKVIEESVSTIMSFCRGDKKLKNILEDLQNDYKLYQDIKDSRIFLRDIKLLEKVLGVENE